MIQGLRVSLGLSALAATLAACSAVGATGQGVSAVGNTLSSTAGSAQQQVHQATGAATQ